MMKVLLINPSFDRSRQYGHLNRLVKPGLPLSIGALAGYLQAQGVEVKVADDQVDDLSLSGVRNMLKEFLPDIVGMTCLTPNVFRVFELAGFIKGYSEDIWVVLGGAHPTVCPDECLGHEKVDFIVRQEGEVTLWELVKLRNNELKKENITGLSFKENGKIYHNPDRPFQQKLDDFPKFPFQLLMTTPDRYNPGHLVTSRGCPFKCVFCSSRNISGFGYRSLSAKRVIEEIEGLIKNYKIKSLMFEDDNFLVDKKRAVEICDSMIAAGFNKMISWRCQARADLVSYEVLKKMKDAGCINISFGIETSSQRLMDLIKKGETVEDNIKAVKLAKSVGLGARGAFILGLPTETREESLATIKLAKKLPLDEVKFSLATPYPGSPLYEMAKKEGCIVDGKWDRLNTTVGLGKYEPIYFPKNRTTAELKKLQRRAHLEFYLRPRIIFSLFNTAQPDNITSLPRVTSARVLLNYLKTFSLFIFETIKLKPNNNKMLSIDELYPQSYFLSDKCEGFDDFKKGKGLSYVKKKEAEMLNPKNGEFILDVGCGRGELLYYCAQRGSRVVGIEYSSDALKLAKETLDKKGHLVKAKAGKLPFGDGLFNKVIMADVLEHLTAKEAADSLKELARVCCKGGVVLVHTSPNLNFVRISGLLRLFLVLMGKAKVAGELGRKLKDAEGRHINIQSPFNLKRLVKKIDAQAQVWIDSDILRSGNSKFTQSINNSKMNKFVMRIQNLKIVNYLLGNDLWAEIRVK